MNKLKTIFDYEMVGYIIIFIFSVIFGTSLIFS
jgi:hypothetical protein